MKKSILLSALGFIAISINAQEVKEKDVPANIKAAFTKAHPAAKVDEWEKEGDNYEVKFTENKVESSVDIGPNGQILETESEIKVAELPKAVTEYCTKNMPGKKIKEAAKITDATGKVTYEAEVGKNDYIFDSNGVFIKKVVKKPKNKKDDNNKK